MSYMQLSKQLRVEDVSKRRAFPGLAMVYTCHAQFEASCRNYNAWFQSECFNRWQFKLPSTLLLY
jgi:hypothetical protein